MKVCSASGPLSWQRGTFLLVEGELLNILGRQVDAWCGQKAWSHALAPAHLPASEPQTSDKVGTAMPALQDCCKNQMRAASRRMRVETCGKRTFYLCWCLCSEPSSQALLWIQGQSCDMPVRCVWVHPVPAAAFLPHTSLSPPVRWGRRPHGYESRCLEEQKVQKVPHTCVFAGLLGSGPGILRIRLGQNCLSVQRRRECLRGASEKRGSHRLIQVTPGSERGWASPQATPLEVC